MTTINKKPLQGKNEEETKKIMDSLKDLCCIDYLQPETLNSIALFSKDGETVSNFSDLHPTLKFNYVY